MIDKLTIADRIEIYADDGRTSAPLKLWKPQIEKLRKEGFEVTEKKPTTRRGEFYCDISWDNPRGYQSAYMLAVTNGELTNRLHLCLLNLKSDEDKQEAYELSTTIRKFNSRLQKCLSTLG